MYDNFKDKLENFFIELWYKKKYSYTAKILTPFSGLYYLGYITRNYYYEKFSEYSLSEAPIITVGNITVGGTGKTPFTISLAKFLKSLGYNPVIVTKNYNFKTVIKPNFFKIIDGNDGIETTGDEPAVLWNNLKDLDINVVLCKERKFAVRKINELKLGDIILTDDGLQDYSIKSDIKICLLDTLRHLGNKNLLPKGPLREPAENLNKFDFVLYKSINNFGDNFYLESKCFIDIKTGKEYQLDKFKQKTVYAIAGIANPEGFYISLRDLDVNPIYMSFTDHYNFQETDLIQYNDYPLVMTEKDAVKINYLKDKLLNQNIYYLKVEAVLSDKFKEILVKKLEKLRLSSIEQKVS